MSWIRIHRKILEWEWFDDDNVFKLFLVILLLANWEDKTWKGEVVKRGSFITSIDKLSQKTGLSVRQTRTALDKLKSTNEVTSKSSSKGTVIQVVNYDTYQEATNEMTIKRQTNDKPVDKPHDNEMTTTKNNKEVKKKRNKEESTRAKFSPPDLFEVIQYFIQNGYTESSARKAFRYYETGNWKDSSGKQVRNWKQKMQAVWFKPEHQETGQTMEGII